MLVGSDGVSDEELVRRFRSGEARAFDELVRRYRLRIYRTAYRWIRDGPRSEELVQETFIRVYRNIRRFDLELSFSTWIYKIATNLARNEVRDRYRRQRIDGPVGPAADLRLQRLTASAETRPDQALEESEVAVAVQDVIARLSPKFREVFVLREMQGLSYREIARIIRRPIGTVRSRVNRARRQFRQEMAPILEELER